MSTQDYQKRQARNEKSRNTAEKDRELWSADEVEFLLAFFDPDDLDDLAASLGRTVEATRQKFYDLRRNEKRVVAEKKVRELGKWSGGFTSLADMGY